jgi:predicted metal-binding membrane protein
MRAGDDGIDPARGGRDKNAMTVSSRFSRTIGAGLWVAFFAAILLAWVVLWRMAGMAGLDLFGRPAAREAMAAATFGPLFGMWALMMAAMMLPTLVPTLATYAALIRQGAGSRAGWTGVVAGYLAVWIGFAAVIALAQTRLLGHDLVDDFGAVASARAAGALLVLAGLWQFTRAKEICHGVCIAPMTWFLARWRPGAAGGARMGAGLGAFCVGCCWTYMALGFAGGTMNLAWMGIATALMVLEKLPAIGHAVMRPAGALMMAGGIAWGVS